MYKSYPYEPYKNGIACKISSAVLLYWFIILWAFHQSAIFYSNYLVHISSILYESWIMINALKDRCLNAVSSNKSLTLEIPWLDCYHVEGHLSAYIGSVLINWRSVTSHYLQYKFNITFWWTNCLSRTNIGNTTYI